VVIQSLNRFLFTTLRILEHKKISNQGKTAGDVEIESEGHAGGVFFSNNGCLKFVPQASRTTLRAMTCH
jgi:hypothetical protein